MAVFINHSKKIVLFTSYKVGYSTLYSQNDNGLKYLHYKMDFNIYKHLIKHLYYKRYFLVRHPYQRFLSLFNDKYRKQPKRILQKLHTWENVHRCLFPYLDINEHESDEVIAQKFQDMKVSEFLSILPEVLHQDEHFMPQCSSVTFKLFNLFKIPLSIDNYFRIEDQKEDLNALTGVNLNFIKNKNEVIQKKQILSEDDKSILNKLYASDFLLGNYSKE